MPSFIGALLVDGAPDDIRATATDVRRRARFG